MRTGTFCYLAHSTCSRQNEMKRIKDITFRYRHCSKEITVFLSKFEFLDSLQSGQLADSGCVSFVRAVHILSISAWITTELQKSPSMTYGPEFRFFLRRFLLLCQDKLSLIVVINWLISFRDVWLD